MKCKISFVVPVFNTPLEKLQRCISSILAVKCVENEIIVINDGSAQKLCVEYETYFQNLNNKQIQYVYQSNMGVSSARNLGISLASGEYVMLVDSDDEIIPEAIGDVYYADLVLFQFVFIKGRKKKRILRCAITGESRDVPCDELAWLITCGKLRGSCGLLYKRDFLITHGITYEEGCIQGEDADFNFRFMKAGSTAQYFKKASYIYHFSTETARSRWKKMPEKMISSGAARFEQALDYLPMLFPEDYESRKHQLIITRIHDIYRQGIELCCAKRATDERKREIERLMISLTLPETVDQKTKRQYLDIINRRWGKIWLIARIRQCYLWLMGI